MGIGETFLVMGWVTMRFICWVYKNHRIFPGEYDRFLVSEIRVLGTSPLMNPEDGACSRSWRKGEIRIFMSCLNLRSGSSRESGLEECS